jgi:hypothetical protein
MKVFIAVCLGVIVLAPAANSAEQDSGLASGKRQHSEQSNATGSGCGAHSACDNSRGAPLPPAGTKPGKTATDDWENTGGTANGGGNKTAGNGGTFKDNWENTGGSGGGTSHKGGTVPDDWQNTSGTATGLVASGKRQH